MTADSTGRFDAVRSVAAGLVDLVFAPVCLACAGTIAAGDTARLVCRLCRSRLRPVPPPICPRCGAPRLRTGRRDPDHGCAECAGWPDALAIARSGCVLAPPADALVHQLKYRGWPALAGPMAERMVATLLPDEAARAAVVVPVPTTAARRRQRGYNQAELLAREYARRTDRQLAPILERGGSAGSQTALGPASRGANVAGAFRVADRWSARARGSHVLVVDDVLTTGATLAACAIALAASGAAWVGALTFARALDRRVISDLPLDPGIEPPLR